MQMSTVNATNIPISQQILNPATEVWCSGGEKEENYFKQPIF